MELKSLSIDELQALKADVEAEIAARMGTEKKMVPYSHDCANAAKHHLGKYKHWAKLVSAVDTSKSDGYAFSGEFLVVERQHRVPDGAIVVERCDNSILVYRVTDAGKEQIAQSSARAMVSLIDSAAQALNGENK
jgi:hypothetical protein